MADRLTPEPWMQDPSVAQVFDALGYPDVDVRFVGGCVRDALLQRAITDIDIATPDVPSVVFEKLTQAGLKAVPTGLSHGTVTAVANGRGFEVTTLRKDTACDGRHAAVEFTSDWTEDASRRDFTFNALSLLPDGTLFDPFGGVADAKAGVVRFVGEARDRIQEDYLRILRYFRFLARYGTAAPDAKVLADIGDLRAGLSQLSAERVQGELLKLLQAVNPRAAVEAMISTGVLDQIAEGDVKAGTLGELIKLETRFRLTDKHTQSLRQWHTRWAALFDAQAEKLAARLKCSNKDQKRIAGIMKAAHQAPDSFTPPQRHHYLYAFGRDVAPAGILVGWARAGGETESEWLDLYEHALTWRSPVFPLTGADVTARGMDEGPEVGAVLATLERRWIDSGFKLSVENLHEELAVLAKEHGPQKK